MEVFDDLSGDDVGVGKIGTVFERLILQPEDVEVEFVALGQFFVGEGPKAVCWFSLVTVL